VSHKWQALIAWPAHKMWKCCKSSGAGAVLS